jgi:uncharacterized protein YcnI
MTNRLISRRRAPKGVRRAALALLCATGLTLATSSIAKAHVTVQPKAAKAGGHERYVVRVPNEKLIPTSRVEIRFPAGLRVTAFLDVPGWKLEVLTDSAKHITGAVWTGTLPPQRFVEFPFVAANPKEATKLVWPAFQTYADGEKVEWTGAEGTKTPASVTTISAGDVAPSAAGSADSAGAARTANLAGATGGGGTTRWVPWLALLIAVLSLALSLRRPASRVA